MKGGNDIWNSSGQQRGQITSLIPKPFMLGGVAVPGYEFTIDDGQGNVRTMNTAQMKFQGMAYEHQINSMMAAGRDKVAKIKAEADTKRLDKQADISSKKVVAGESDTFVVDVLKGGTTKLNIGVKKTGKGSGKDSFGRSSADVGKVKDRATKIFDKSIDVSVGRFGLKGLKKEDGKLYSATTRYMYDMVENGATDGDAADMAKDFATRAWKLKDDGEKDYIAQTLREVEAMQKQGSGDHKSMWAD